MMRPHDMPQLDSSAQRFRRAYGAHRADEGRGSGGTAELLALPYLRTGTHRRPWQVRTRTFEQFVKAVVIPHARAVGRPLHVLDAGAGNGWLCYRLTRMGHEAVALDIRDDDVDGLGAAAGYGEELAPMFTRVVGGFEALPLRAGAFDIVVFNASLHYAQSLSAVLDEAARAARQGGRIVVLDSPFYAAEAEGAAMAAEKRAQAGALFGARADDLLGIPFIEFLTRERLENASAGLPLHWRRHRVRYPLWYEARPLIARLRRRRRPSRFDVWEATAP